MGKHCPRKFEIVYLLIHEEWPIGIKRRDYMGYPSWSVYLPQVSESPWRTSVGHSLIGNSVISYNKLYISAVRQAYLDTTGLCAFDEGYAPYSPHLIPIRGSADRLKGLRYGRKLKTCVYTCFSHPWSWTRQAHRKYEKLPLCCIDFTNDE